MNATSALGAAALSLCLSVAPAFAFTTSNPNLSASPLIEKADFVQGHEIIAGIPAREFARTETSKAMAERYFDVDVVVTLGALAIASGAFVAAGLAGSRRRIANAPRANLRDGWRDGVMQAVEADLMQFCEGMQRAA